ncbi:hypothetical protein LguiB_016630 [Lonicera macranthoides]
MQGDSDTTKMRELLIDQAEALNAETLLPLAPNTTQLARGEVDKNNATSVPINVTNAKPPSRNNDTQESLLEKIRQGHSLTTYTRLPTPGNNLTSCFEAKDAHVIFNKHHMGDNHNYDAYIPSCNNHNYTGA